MHVPFSFSGVVYTYSFWKNTAWREFPTMHCFWGGVALVVFFVVFFCTKEWIEQTTSDRRSTGNKNQQKITTGISKEQREGGCSFEKEWRCFGVLTSLAEGPSIDDGFSSTCLFVMFIQGGMKIIDRWMKTIYIYFIHKMREHIAKHVWIYVHILFWGNFVS